MNRNLNPNMKRDRSWMYKMRGRDRSIRDEYEEGVKGFLEYCFSNPKVHCAGLIRCPCRKCENTKLKNRLIVGKHLISRGFMENYHVWDCHDENPNHSVINDENMGEGSAANDENREHDNEKFRDVVVDAFSPEVRNECAGTGPSTSRLSSGPEEPNKEARDFLNLMSEANQPLHEGSQKTVLEWCAEFLNYKTQHSISAAACDNMLKLSSELLKPEEQQKVPYGFDELKKLMRGLGLVHHTYDVCESNDFLYYGDGIDLKRCPVCNKERYKQKKSATGKDIPNKKLWYFPITPRLQRLFMCRKTAKHMTWHKQCEAESDVFIHPAGAKAWKDFDKKHRSFAADDRNVRLGLCTDGFNPHSLSATPYSCWPVFITPYNLPPDMCMKDESIFLSMIISGPESPGVNLDVLLRPLIDELKTLWTDGALTYDSSRQQNFLMRAAVIWTISDFPAYGMLSGWSTHGKLACPYCMQNTKSFRLPNGGKACWFDCHRQFLPLNHPARKDTHNFYKDRCEKDTCAERLSSAEVYDTVKNIPGIEWPGGAQQKHPGFGKDHNWKKKSIFWELPYWSTLLIRNNLDVMHIEKNFFENIFRTIIDDLEKTKDNIKSRLDLPKFTRRKKLFLKPRPGKKAEKPKAAYTLSKEQRRYVCQWLKELRFPDSHVSNIGRRVKDVETGRVYGMKSHDCHVFMQRLLPIAFRDFLPNDIWGALTEVSNFFRALCAPEICRAEMEDLQKTVVETICKLETFFPPSFFDSMEHLAIHLPYEALVGGPVFYRWMYPFERKMFVLKSMVKNKARVEGSICEAYLNSEISNFCSHYFDREVDSRPKRLRRNEVLWGPEFPNQLSIFIPKGEPIGKPSTRGLSPKEYNAAMFYILTNCEEVDPWMSEFAAQYRDTVDDDQWDNFQARNFVSWFQQKVLSSPKGQIDERLRTLAAGGRDLVTLYRGYKVNGLKFHTEEGCRHLTTTNSGVCVRVSTGSGTEDYYGMLEEVIEMDFVDSGPHQKIVLFKCTWYDNNKAITIHPKYGLVDIDPQHKLKTDEEFMLATQASQVYYAPYPSSRVHRPRRGKFSVCINRPRHIINVSSLAAQKEVNRENDYYQDDDPPQGSQLAVDFSQFNVPDLADEETEVVDLPDEVILEESEYQEIEEFDEYEESDVEESDEEEFSKNETVEQDDEW